MKRAGRLVSVGLAGILTISSLSNVSCTPAWIPLGEVSRLEQESRISGYIAGFEGMQPFSGYRIKGLVDRVSDVGIAGAATTGNPFAHLSYAKKAHENNKLVYVIGYSSGGNDARAFAELCKSKGIPIRTLILLDPTWLARPLPAKIPDNVEKVVCYMSSDEGSVYGVRATTEHLENTKKTFLMPAKSFYVGHLDLPDAVSGYVKAEILEISRR